MYIVTVYTVSTSKTPKNITEPINERFEFTIIPRVGDTLVINQILWEVVKVYLHPGRAALHPEIHVKFAGYN